MEKERKRFLRSRFFFDEGNGDSPKNSTTRQQGCRFKHVEAPCTALAHLTFHLTESRTWMAAVDDDMLVFIINW